MSVSTHTRLRVLTATRALFATRRISSLVAFRTAVPKNAVSRSFTTSQVARNELEDDVLGAAPNCSIVNVPWSTTVDEVFSKFGIAKPGQVASVMILNRSSSPSDSPKHENASKPRPRPPAPRPAPPPHDILALRSLVSTKDSGAIIGKAGENVAEVRKQAGVRASVGNIIAGIEARVFTVTGNVKAVSKAYQLILTKLSSTTSSPISPSSPSTVHTSIRLLIPDKLVGSIIGHGGQKMQAIQDSSGARLATAKELLPQSTECIVKVQGSPEAIGRAIEEIGNCLLVDWERGLGAVLFHSHPDEKPSSGNRRSSRSSSSSPGSPKARSPVSAQPAANLLTQNIPIPSDLVGCIIGQRGSRIAEMRRLSGSRISIAEPHDDTGGGRMLTLVGTPEGNEIAVQLIHKQMESEKAKGVGI